MTTAMSSFDVHKPEHLKLDGNLAENWRVFKQNYEIFSIATELENKKEQQRIGIFLNLCGPEIIEIFNNLGLSAEDKKKYNAVVAAVERYCIPKKNEVYETFKFNKRNKRRVNHLIHFFWICVSWLNHVSTRMKTEC